MPALYFGVAGLLALMFGWLTYDHYRPWVNFHAEALSFAGVLLLAFGIVLRGDRALRLPRLLLAVSAVALIPWIQWVGGLTFFAGDALVSSMYLIALAIAIGVGYGLRVPANETVTDLPGFVHVMWVAAVFSAGIGLAQWLGVHDALQMYALQADPGDRAMGNLGQPNQLATLILMGVACYTLAYERNAFGSFTYGLGVAFLSFVLLLTESRTALLGVASMACFLACKTWGGSGRVGPRSVLTWAAICLLGRLLVPTLHSVLLLGTGREMPFTEGAARWHIWSQVAWGIKEAPWLGYGWNHTPTAHAAGAIAFPGSLTYTNAHNAVLDLLAWNGIPLGLAVVGLCGYWLFSRLRLALGASAVYAMAALLPLAIHSMLEYPFAYGYFLVAAGLLIGLTEVSVGRTVVVDARLIWGLLGIWGLAGVLIVKEYLLIEEDFRVVRFENLRIGHTPTDYVAPNILFLSQMGAMLRAARIRPTPGMDPRQLDELAQVARRFSFSALALRNAIALGLNGDAEAASKQMEVLRGMYGEGYYAAARAELRLLQEQKYPQLKSVRAP
jgi:hypothetical protein